MPFSSMNHIHSPVKLARWTLGEAALGPLGARRIVNVLHSGDEQHQRTAHGRRSRFKPPDERRKDILEAATRLFSTRGFDETSVQDIARQANVAAGTVYLYVESKEDILRQIHENFHMGVRARFMEIGSALLTRGGDYVEMTATMLDALVEYAREHRAACQVIARFVPRIPQDAERAERAFEAMTAEAFKAGIAAGSIQVSDPDMVARILYVATNQTLGPALASGTDQEVERVVAALKEVYRKVLATDATV